MNKTPQEQAEAMAWKLARAQHEALRLSESQMINTNGHGIDYLVWDNCRVPLVETLQQEIPLDEVRAYSEILLATKFTLPLPTHSQGPILGKVTSHRE